MKSYIKIYGPPVLKAIKKLRRLALDVPEVCISDVITESAQQPIFDTREGIIDFFGESTGMREVSIERCNQLISDSGETLGEYDFFFEWFKKPTSDELNQLIQDIDEALEPLNVRYTITTK